MFTCSAEEVHACMLCCVFVVYRLQELCLVFRKLVSNFESQFLAAMMEDAQRQSQQAAFGTPTGLSSPSLIAMGGSSGSTPAVAASSSAAVQKRHSRTGSAGNTCRIDVVCVLSDLDCMPTLFSAQLSCVRDTNCGGGGVVPQCVG